MIRPSRRRSSLQAVFVIALVVLTLLSGLLMRFNSIGINARILLVAEQQHNVVVSSATTADTKENVFLRITSIKPSVLYRDVRYKKPLIAFTDDDATDNDNKNGVNSRRKSWCIWHAGPPKSATTAIQQDLTVFSDSGHLSHDHYVYSGLCWRNGKYCGRGNFLETLKDENHTLRECVPQLKQAQSTWLKKQQQQQTQSSDKTALSFKERQAFYDMMYNEVNCSGFNSLVDQLNDLYANGMSIVVSDEQLSFGLPRYSFVWNLLQQMLGDDWNFKVLLGYRRWVEFLPSRKWQNDLNDRVWNKWPQDGGRHVEPLFPSLSTKLDHGTYTSAMLKQLQGGAASELWIRVFNMHGATSSPPAPSRSLRSILFCSVIPEMTSSCRQSLALDDVNTAQGKEEPNVVVGGMKSFECDMLATAAKNASLLHVAPHLSRKEVGEAVCDFYKNLRNKDKDNNNNNNSYTFPLTCPSTTEMQAFLNISLQKEQMIMPDLYADPVFGKEQHTATFWSNVQKNKYCAIDTHSTLQQEEWKHFFTNLGEGATSLQVSK